MLTRLGCSSAKFIPRWRANIRSRSRIPAILMVASLSLNYIQPAFAETVVHDIAADWSDERNPNGAWTYTGNNGAVLTEIQVDWDRKAEFLTEQRAWANAILAKPNHVPMWFKASQPSGLDVPGVGMHGSEGTIDAWVGVVWTSPVDGAVAISGGVWQALKTTFGPYGGNHQIRNSDWRLRHNNFVIAAGNVSGTDTYSSASPFTFDAGASIDSLQAIEIATGDELALEFMSPTSYACFIGIDLVISATTTD